MLNIPFLYMKDDIYKNSVTKV